MILEFVDRTNVKYTYIYVGQEMIENDVHKDLR